MHESSLADLTDDELETLRSAVARVREDYSEPKASDLMCLVVICRAWLAETGSP